MLEPRERQHLMEALRPPPGYELDRAVGTTYSLDLLALLTAPLAFTFFEHEDQDGRPEVDPLALLETMRRYAGRVSIFCQAGQISVPRDRQPLLGYLEGSVYEVAVRRKNGSFHPKVWALRYVAPERPVYYRFLCLSRNLTFDRSWDTMLVLDGELTGRKNAIGSNNPIGEFFAALPGLALRPLQERVRNDVDLIQHEIRRVRFRVPEGFETFAFLPLGIRGAPKWPFGGRVDRMLVISPFVSEGMLARLSQGANAEILISRLESLDAIELASESDFERIYVLNPGAVPEENGEDPIEGGASWLSGLHAKLYVADAGWDARVWTGSANATNAAFGNNVEFLVELGGKKSQCGIDSLLGRAEDDTGLAHLLQEYVPKTEELPDTERARLEELADGVRRALAMAKLEAEVSVLPGEIERFKVRLRLASEDAPEIPRGVAVRCWPITLSAVAQEISVGPGDIAVFSPLSFEAITAFVAFEVTAASDETEVRRRFVVNVPLQGAPTDRHERILRSLLDTPDKVLRLILYLLAEIGDDGSGALVGTRAIIAAKELSSGSGSVGFPLFEALVRALERDPVKLDRIARLLDDLRKTPEGRRLIPEDLEEVWDLILSARRRLEA